MTFQTQAPVLFISGINYDDYGGDLTDTGFVLLSTDGGNTWPYKIAEFLSDILGRDTFFDLSSYRGNSNVKIAFRYKAHDELL